ncbi:hypothetical protein A2673_01610 [Candidatus Kaiserbacteria bacterium RIFCSPHIGHO2_01_FULL_50_13]|uniref:Cytidyltransferase-like domain-containing protein n=1 Tax=Candidatus Kaiserbacteria bacterium RIFCSPLOWO2_01_FULL_50_24 TaxID=1798507 RepID=A0A1F6EMD8_9BACT|nr:MAG: hypothetical protein A2673_01610 [Candidatus Kaiserbacteria bacterium RIFCSPHIGHO2_01_FULL_50_13]OGG74819.1 MAG: hypothetical protein A3A34_00310 [Candidatus Kaiserbacteria bacterium RIFCSPLOWO2_01_FULL_50_24]OGG81402.1 MAG: hypothetical protein A3H74_03095 [Candidatus Kaiserbacteria bacterium RIFCSPLOWO2_02_FULL_51_13]
MADAKKSRKRKRVGITAGAFDLCHAGHFLMFDEARRACDYLIVCLQEDPSRDRPEKNKPVMTLAERMIILRGIKYIDEIVPYKTERDLYNILRTRKPDIRIIGADWRGKLFTGHDLPIKMHYNSRSHNYSSSALRERVWKEENAKRTKSKKSRRSK